jgi:glucose/arabinose dehydrogenase
MGWISGRPGGRAAQRATARLAASRPLRLEPLEERIALTTLPAGFAETTLEGGLTNPTSMAIAPDGRIFVTEQGGSVRVISRDGDLLPSAFLTLSVNSTGERGLLGLAFDPNFTTNQFVYVYYTTSAAPIHNRVSRFTATFEPRKPLRHEP